MPPTHATPHPGRDDFVGKPCEAEGLKKLLLHALQFRARKSPAAPRQG